MQCSWLMLRKRLYAGLDWSILELSLWTPASPTCLGASFSSPQSHDQKIHAPSSLKYDIMVKQKLTESVLNKCGIFYNSQPTSELPPHIEDLKSDLIDFDCTEFGNISTLDVNLDYQQLTRKFWSYEYKNQLQVVNVSILRATNLATRQDRESEWQGYYAKYFCDSLIAAAEITEKDDRR